MWRSLLQRVIRTAPPEIETVLSSSPQLPLITVISTSKEIKSGRAEEAASFW